VPLTPVTTWTLESLRPPAHPPRPLPDGVRLEQPATPTPELARWLYAVVGGPWTWTDRLGWSREQWATELAVPGTELHVLQAEGAPQGYVELQPAGTHVEVRYLGLVETAIGRGWGGLLLEHALDRAWSLPRRHGLPDATRVWVHTCSLDGEAALANYRARGLAVCAEVTTEEDRPVTPPGAWTASTGLEA